MSAPAPAREAPSAAHIPALDGLRALAIPASLILYPLVASCCALVLVAASGASGKPIVSPAFGYLGRISYGLYVFHDFALRAAGVTLLHAMGFSPVFVVGVVGLALTVACAAVSYRFLELPFLRLKRRFSVVET